MGKYLETVYFTEEYGENDYPQKLCNYIYSRIYRKYVTKNRSQKLRLLDIGSGKGNHLVGFSRCGIEAYGLDTRDECIDILKTFDIRKCNIEKDRFPFEDNFFDFAFSKSVLEHVMNTDNFLRETLRVLKPGGIAILLTPDWRSEVKFFWDEYTHVKPFTRRGLQSALKINGFSEVKCECFLQLPFVWKYPYLKFIPWLISLLPDALKYKDEEEIQSRKLVRFSKEIMLIAIGVKEFK